MNPLRAGSGPVATVDAMKRLAAGADRSLSAAVRRPIGEHLAPSNAI